jgi:creatinine amidohydrolase
MSKYLCDLTWPDVSDYLVGRKDIILPFGSVEEHGYHLPLSTDGDIAIKISEGISDLTDIIYAPLVWYGVSNSTVSYAGTIMVDFSSLMIFAASLFNSIKNNGFKKIYLISGHLSGSEISALKEAGRRCTDLEIYMLDYSLLSFDDIMESERYHACELETSLMLYLYPNKVDLKKAVDEEIIVDKYAVNGLSKTKSGVWGSPTRATKEKGKYIYQHIVNEFSAYIRKNSS